MLNAVAQLATHEPRQGQHTAVLFCDIDRFKQINDVYGHSAGDEVLRVLGARFTAALRSDDHAARMGGDELLVVLTGVTDLDAARQVAEELRALAAHPIPFESDLQLRTTLSIGVTLAHPGETPDRLVERADTAMYMAKKSGRDQVIAIG